MGASSRAAIVCFAAAACALAACDVLLGLNEITVRNCSIDVCDATTPNDAAPDVSDANDAGGDTSSDDGPDGFGDDGAPDGWSDAADATGDADGGMGDAGDADAFSLPDVAPPTVTQIWVHWPMPNPDAAIAPGSATLLPHPMAYDASPGDAGQYVLDTVTNLVWESGLGTVATTYIEAEIHCARLPLVSGSPPWRVPTRIELVSLIDFTRTPTLDLEAFGFPAEAGADAGGGVFWTSSGIDRDADPTMTPHWAVSFSDGKVGVGGATSVRCVSGGGP
jgi:hypothetical protein